MARISNITVGVINICSMLLGLAAIVTSIYYHTQGVNECKKAIQNPLLISGLCLLAVSLLGVIGAFSRSSLIMWIYMAVIFLLFVAFLIFTCFVLLITSNGLATAASKVGFKKHSLWNRILNEKRWDDIRSCLIDSQVCRRLSMDDDHPKIIHNNQSSPLEFGCCNPPASCKWEDKNDSDCTKWNKDAKVMCFYCNSCKSGFVESIMKQWRLYAIINFISIIVIIIVYFLANCAKKNNKQNPGYVRYRGHW